MPLSQGNSIWDVCLRYKDAEKHLTRHSEDLIFECTDKIWIQFDLSNYGHNIKIDCYNRHHRLFFRTIEDIINTRKTQSVCILLLSMLTVPRQQMCFHPGLGSGTCCWGRRSHQPRAHRGGRAAANGSLRPDALCPQLRPDLAPDARSCSSVLRRESDLHSISHSKDEKASGLCPCWNLKRWCWIYWSVHVTHVYDSGTRQPYAGVTLCSNASLWSSSGAVLWRCSSAPRVPLLLDWEPMCTSDF